ncbi:FitA-like ribbon-helix-helix domain-containing protein [Pseudomonas koreensis]|uniref:Plasmid stabilization protein n=1 Tax=Pseudomonas koreensis TaxID=198620 RepID=A0A9X3BB83_9PSED|nr:plasmid stabilization protein [Pseudomonas koreensis]MCU7247894.1 plasmid stabilization protein [Pseudomonas koreensis]
MASITIRNLDDEIKEQLRIAAAHNGHSMEEEARLILGRALATIGRAGGLGSRIRNRFRDVEGVELDLPARSEKASAVDFSE